MTVGLAILLILFVALLLLNVPIAVVLAAVTVMAALALGYQDVLQVVASDMASGIDSFTLLAIPFFILAGDIMGTGGLARRLIDFATALVGWFRGGLGLVNTLTCMFFGAISGSSAAAISSIGGTLIPEMNQKGYGKEFNVALTTCSATTGLLIPPSNVMIVYAVAAGNVSIAALFLAGVLPGVLVGLFLMAVCMVVSIKKGYGGLKGSQTLTSVPVRSGFWGHVLNIFITGWYAFPALLLIVVVLGGILIGLFTPTEASAIAVLWAFILSVIIYREIPWKALPEIFIRSGKTTTIVLFLIASSRAMSLLLTNEEVPQDISNFLLNLSENPFVLLMIINVVLLLVGTFMDMTPAILIFTPIFLPIAKQLGLDPVHFGIVMIANLCIGLCTPPVGTCLFIGCSVGKADILKVSKSMLPFYGAMFLALIIITFFPQLSMWLPALLGS